MHQAGSELRTAVLRKSLHQTSPPDLPYVYGTVHTTLPILHGATTAHRRPSSDDHCCAVALRRAGPEKLGDSARLAQRISPERPVVHPSLCLSALRVILVVVGRGIGPARSETSTR